MINPIFKKAFNEESFIPFIEGFIPDVVINKKRAEARHGFNSIQQIAEASGSDLDLVVFIAKPDSTLNARVEITKNTYTVLKSHARSNALIVYLSEDSSEWRLSLITTKVTRTKEGVKESISNPRRFSYLLGPDAKVLTPSSMLSGVIKTTKDLENKFSLAVVSKEFYTRIAVQYSKLVGGTRGEGSRAKKYERTLKLGTSDDAVNANFAIRLIGRLVFCWFLKQKKGNSHTSLIPDELLSVSAVAKMSDYYHSICAPLFFEVLNKPENSRPTFFSYSEIFSKVPFLNGGLFQDHAEDNHKFNRTTGMSERRGVVAVPDEWFVELFGIFEEYNFTIDENTSIDTELSIDPEMLGRIFENLLAEVNPETGASARKATGSFYTPREIVDFMVEESLVAHLKTKTGIDENKMRALTSYDLEDDTHYAFTREEKKILVDAIHETAVLDPACGSGAFPIGMLQRMVHMLGVLDPDCSIYLNKLPAEARRLYSQHNPTYVRKLGVIRECIHGVDIQPIAVDISRLRCFLTLVVDQQVDDNAPNRGIEPLPNLDFKFVCANTLIKPPVHEGPLFGDEFAIALGELIDEYFAPVDQVHKLETARKLQQLISDKTKKELESILKSYSYVKDEKYKKALAQQNEKSDTERMRINNLWGSYENIFQNKPVGFFDTRYFFPAVDRKGGFDIVIGNPPYVGEKGHKDIFRQVANSPLGKRFHQGKMDFFYFFFHLGLDVLSEGGVLSFISTNYYITATSAKNLRDDFFSRTTILGLVNFNELKIFESALGQHNMVTILQKGHLNKPAFTINTNRHGYLGSDILVQIVQGADEQTEYAVIPQTALYKDGNIVLKSSPLDSLLDKMKEGGIMLSDIADVNKGIETGANEVFIFENLSEFNDSLNAEEKNLFKPFYKNSDIKKYQISASNIKYILYINNDFDIDGNMPIIKKYLEANRARLLDRAQIKRSKQEWYTLLWPRNVSLFEKEAIVTSYRPNKASFYYKDFSFYSGTDTYYITNPKEKYSLKFILGVINSLVANKWFFNRGKIKGSILEMTGDNIEKYPIPLITLKNHGQVKNVESLVDQILTLKKQNKDADTKNHEAQIDQLVYKLYDLTSEEIEIVENSSKK